ncbi:hypothetical protein P885DRAFT_45508 [Corynascus similis CBS 632.67]
MTLGTSEGPGGASGPSMADLPHDSRGPNILATCFITWTIAFILVLMRFWTRARIVHALGWADWFIAFALVRAAGLCVSYVIQVKHALGKHVWDVDMPNGFIAMLRAWWFSLLLYIISLSLTKVSICLLYLKIFTFEWARRAAYLVLIIVIITSLWAVSITFTYCIPLQATWDPTVKATFCHSQPTWWVNTGITIATDVMIFVLPIPIVSPLKLPRRQKLVLLCVFTIGFFVCIVSFVRLFILIQVKNSKDPDYTYMPARLSYLTALEVHTAIVVACAMTLKPLVQRFFPALFTPRSDGTYSGGHSASIGRGVGMRGGIRGGGGSSTTPTHHGSARWGLAPLTVGSRPSRLDPLQSQTGRPGEEDEEAVTCLDRLGDGAGSQETIQGMGVGDVESGGMVKDHRQGETKSIHEAYASPWFKSDTSSERTEDIGREATARSMG